MGGWFTRHPRGNYGVNLWKANFLIRNSKLELGNGTKLRFWEDIWCGEAPLSETYPTLYTLADAKGAKAAEVWVIQENQGALDPRCIRSFND